MSQRLHNLRVGGRNHLSVHYNFWFRKLENVAP